MIKINSKFIKIFAIAFAATAAVSVFMVLVVLRGMFSNIYISKGNKSFEAGRYEQAISKLLFPLEI